MELSNKRVLITGADGFIGSHLTEALLDAGCDVRAFVYYNSFNSWGWLDALPDRHGAGSRSLPATCATRNGVRAALQGHRRRLPPRGAHRHPLLLPARPTAYVDTNIRGTLNVLQAARDAEIERVVVTSTSEVYGTARYVPIDEDHPMQASRPTPPPRSAPTALAEAFYRSFGLPVAVAAPVQHLRPAPVGTGRDPTWSRQLPPAAAEIRLGALSPTRDLTYVADTCRGFLQLAACDAAVGREVNLGSGAEIAIGDLAQRLIAMINPQARIATDEQRLRPEKSEVERLLSDPTLVHTLTGWRAEVSLDEGLERTIAWFADKANLARYKADIYNL